MKQPALFPVKGGREHGPACDGCGERPSRLWAVKRAGRDLFLCAACVRPPAKKAA